MLPATASFSVGVAPVTRRFVAASQSPPAAALRATPLVMVEAKEEEEGKENMMQQVKDAGVAGIISYVFWEWAFWGVSVPVCIFGYREVRQHTDLAWLGVGAIFRLVSEGVEGQG
tara:strand:+ start:143 stop:487 length:345 start_codon:yes stop_codon:yes gene_type:complete